MNDIHPNLKKLSESSLALLHGCPRRYQLYKLANIEDSGGGEDHQAFGTSVGAGAQEYLVSENLDKAIMAAWLAWPIDEEEDFGARNKKSLFHAIEAVKKFVAFKDLELSEYKILIYKGVPASELGIKIDIAAGFVHRGHIDAVLQHKITGHLLVYEGKTTKYSNVHEAVYKNSSQALGYSVVVDSIARELGISGETFDVMYGVYKASAGEWQSFLFHKDHLRRASWLKDLLRDMQHIAEYAEDNYFPKRGTFCYSFFRPCPYFDMCDMSDEILLPKDIKEIVDDESRYHFKTTLTELLETQLGKHV